MNEGDWISPKKKSPPILELGSAVGAVSGLGVEERKLR